MRDPASATGPEFEQIQSSELIALGPLEPPQETANLIHLGPHEEPTSTYTMSQARENLERIALGLPVTDAAGNYFPPTLRSESEKQLLRELASVRSQLRATQRQVLHAEVEAGFARIDAALSRARGHSHHQGPISGLISALSFGIL